MALIQVRRGNEGIITVSEDAFNNVYGPAGFTRVDPSAPAAAPSHPAPQPSYSPQPAPPTTPIAIPAGLTRLTDQEVAQGGSSNSDVENIQYVGTYPYGFYVGYKVPTAVVIGPNGDRVKVRTDNRTGMYRTQAEMLSQGYQTERAPGVAQNGSTPGGAAVNMQNRPALWTVDGQIISGQDPNYTAYVGAGATPIQQTPSPSAPTPGAPASGPSDSSPAFVGVDTTGWTDSMKQSYEAMYNYSQTLLRQGQIVNPNVTIDQSTIDRFTQQARDEVDPYYRQIFDQANQDLKTALESISSTYGGRVRDIGKAFGQNLENAQKSFASRGLEMSSDRDKAEASIARDATDALSDAERAAREQAQRVGTETERQVGSSNLTSERGSLFTGSQPVLGRPGVYNLSAPNTTRSLFSAQGGVFGSDERNKAYDAEVRARDLLNSRQLLAASNTM